MFPVDQDEPWWTGKIRKTLFTLSRYTASVLDTVTNRDDNRSDAGTVWTRLTVACWLTTVSHGCLTVERRIMPEELRWCPGSPRNYPALVSLSASFEWFKKQTLGLLSGNRRFNMVYADTMLCFSGVDKVVVPVGPGVQTSTHRGCKPAQCELDFNSKHCKH